jgi:hypothetical protein
MSGGTTTWTEQEEAALRQAIEENVSLNRLTVRFKRSASGIQTQAKALGLKVKAAPRLPRNERDSWSANNTR